MSLSKNLTLKTDNYKNKIDYLEINTKLKEAEDTIKLLKKELTKSSSISTKMVQ